jgi:hypothetical protein
MRGRERSRKKHIKRAGWSIAGERPNQAPGAHSLLLRGPGGVEVKVEAPSRPRAYYAAEAMVFARRRELRPERRSAAPEQARPVAQLPP